MNFNKTKIKIEIEKLTNKNFGFYLAGLIEGDGNFYSKPRKDCALIKYSLSIALHKHDEFTAIQIKNRLGQGTYVYDIAESNAIRLEFQYQSLEKVFNLVNGKFVGPYKINQMKYYGFDKKFGKLKPKLSRVSLCNAWLTGFFDADGTVNIFVRNNKKMKAGVLCSIEFSLSQKNPFLLEAINSSFPNQKKIYKTTRKDGRICFELRFFNQKELKLMFDYFKKQPLLTKKNNQCYIAWQAFQQLKEKRHLTEHGLQEFKNLQKALRNQN